MKSDFLTQLPILLRLLADPRTPHTVDDLWCRVFAHGWDDCQPLLLNELQSGESDVKRLVMEIVMEQAGNSGLDSVQSFVPTIVSFLSHENGLVRMCAISAVRELLVDDQTTVNALRQIVCEDEPILACAAFRVLLEFEPQIIKAVVQLFRDNAK